MNKLPKRYFFSKICIALSCALSIPVIAAEQNTENNVAETEIERIVTTGSRIKRTELEGVVNVFSITSDDMIKNGFSSVYDALANNTAATGAVLGEVNTGSYTPGAKELNLRGLGPEYTLILVNGKRLAYYPMPFGGQTNFVNLDMIPTAMVDRIDIQTGGASAIYGSEAMGGVVNIITKKGIEGQYIDIDGGVDTYGSNRRKSVSFVGGYSKDAWTLDYALEYKDNAGLFSSDRPYHDSLWDNPAPNGNRELNRSITVYSLDTPTINNYSTQYCNTETNPHPKAVQHFIQRNNYGMSCGWDETGDNHLINKNQTFSGYLNSEYELSNDLTLFANGFYISQEKKGSRGTLFFNDTEFWDPDLANKDGSQGASVKYMWRKVLDNEYTNDGYGRTFKDTSYSFNFGVMGQVADLDYSLGFSRSEYDFSDRYLHNTKTGLSSVLGAKLGEVNNLPIHRPNYGLWFGELTPDSALQIADWATYQGNSFNNTFTADITGDLFELPAGPVAFSAYIEFMNEGTEAIPDERVLNKEFEGLTGVTTKGERDRYAAAIEVLVPVTDTLDIESAVRYDYYDDDSNVGGAFSTQLGLSYRPVEEVVFRTAMGTTFRGPDLAAVYKGFSGNFGAGNDRILADACKQLANSDEALEYDASALATSCANADLQSNPDQPSLQVNFESVSTGDKSLKEETGSTFTAGIVYEFNEYLSFNIDYYDITIKDKIQVLSAGYIMSIDYDCQTGVFDSNSERCKNMASRIQRYDGAGNGTDRLGNPISGDPYTPHTITEGYINASERQDAGVDIGVKGLAETDLGSFKYQFNLTRTLKKKERLRAGDELLDLLDDQNNMDFRTLANASVTWEHDNTAISVLANYKGALWNNANYGDRVKLPAWTRYNLTLGQQLNEDARVIFTINNLFNAMPPQDETFTGYPFYRMGAYDTLGRQFSLRLTYAF
ncbi:TonB-dependent receptor [Pseudoalteromonas sp. NEC-BIFX-2020_002]|uniref:TonB-dependent receptor n=1 Tax=Pseudoalteromonas neustonica TaxID=1840331 RepID=A0ABU9U740_9GAMM|nr:MULTISPECIES: TonB-dependent receptor [Pseudoalteromonas]NMR25140.1 TonB-dependent receptor [Pseudoalteromonas sp. NEC-BIFX-2020_015]NNG42421.1 TonB-dependent receptor [Pseudoalteromonas sp. NEC-BIFX-2020_002]